MTRKEIIDGLKFTVDMFLFDPRTGETFTEPRNDMDKTTIDACKGAIELLEQTDGDLKAEIDKLPRIKVGNSNSPTVKYCIDERLLYEILEKMKGEAEREKEEQTYDWCKGCKEYDTEKHCCHRYSSFIRESLQENINAVLEDIKAEIEKEQDEYPYPLDIEHAIDIIEKHISGKEEE